MDRVIDEHASDEGRALLRRLERMTTVGAVLRMVKKDVGEFLDRPLEEILTMPEVQHVFDSIRLGAKVPTPPVLIVQAVHDYLIDVEDIDRLAGAYSAGGADVTYHRDAFNEHLLLHPLSTDGAALAKDGFVRRLDRSFDPNEMADDVEPGDLCRNAAGRDRGQGDHRQGVHDRPYDGGALSAPAGRGYTVVYRRIAPRSSRAVAATVPRRPMPRSRPVAAVQAPCSQDGPKNTEGASVT